MSVFLSCGSGFFHHKSFSKAYRIGLMDKPVHILKKTCLLCLLGKLNECLLVQLGFVAFEHDCVM